MDKKFRVTIPREGRERRTTPIGSPRLGLDTLRAVHAQILEERRLRDGSVEDVRAAVGTKRKTDFSDSPFRTVVNVVEKRP